MTSASDALAGALVNYFGGNVLAPAGLAVVVCAVQTKHHLQINIQLYMIITIYIHQLKMHYISRLTINNKVLT